MLRSLTPKTLEAHAFARQEGLSGLARSAASKAQPFKRSLRMVDFQKRMM
jgi:hypothetical protein